MFNCLILLFLIVVIRCTSSFVEIHLLNLTYLGSTFSGIILFIVTFHQSQKERCENYDQKYILRINEEFVFQFRVYFIEYTIISHNPPFLLSPCSQHILMILICIRNVHYFGVHFSLLFASYSLVFSYSPFF